MGSSKGANRDQRLVWVVYPYHYICCNLVKKKYAVTFAYGQLSIVGRKVMWEALQRMGVAMNLPWLVMGILISHYHQSQITTSQIFRTLCYLQAWKMPIHMAFIILEQMTLFLASWTGLWQIWFGWRKKKEV